MATNGAPAEANYGKLAQNDTGSIAKDATVSDQTADRNTATLASLVDFANDFDFVSPDEDVLTLKNNQRLICIGDVHGDLTAFEEFLSISGVYGLTGHWVGGNTIFVQCGDILDRGSEELACMALLAQLSREAAKAGGAVIMLYGNHEVWNSKADFYFTTDDRDYEHVIGHAIDEAFQSRRWRMQYGRSQPCRACWYFGQTLPFENEGGSQGWQDCVRSWWAQTGYFGQAWHHRRHESSCKVTQAANTAT
jgi:hypothetical protein